MRVVVAVAAGLWAEGSVAEQPREVTACDTRCAEERFAAAAREVRPPRAVVNGLTVVDRTNERLVWKEFLEPRVLVATVTSRIDSYVDASTRKEPLRIKWDAWATVVPELKAFCAKIPRGSRDRRVAEHLGLRWPEKGQERYVVEFWVRPADLFRPCADAEITDAVCQVDFPPEVSVEHVVWMQQHRKDTTYPWTQLGYTYDWGEEETHVGFSEFIVRQGAEVRVEREPRKLDAYCDELGDRVVLGAPDEAAVDAGATVSGGR